MSKPEEAPLVTVESERSIAVLLLNRPAALNAINAPLADAVGSALERLDADPACRVIVLTGAGRAFCAGADLAALGRGESVYPSRRAEWGFGGLTQHRLRTPVIAAVNGFALGGGLEMALACDLIVLAEDGFLGLPEVTRGLVAAAGGALRLTQHMPQKVATEALLTGARIDAATAYRWGLVNRLAPGDAVLRVALDLAEQIAANAPLAVQASKELSRALLGGDSEWERAAWHRNDELTEQVATSADAAEGASAFLEKRPPVWGGR